MWIKGIKLKTLILINTPMNEHLIFDKEAKIVQWGKKRHLQQMVLEYLDVDM